MAVSLGNNLMALRALRRLAENSAGLARTSERLSSGMRINRASDDAAGLALSSSLQANSRIYSQAIRNGNDGISALNIADGGLDQLSSLVTRMKELATQAANGSYSASQRRSLDSEAQRLKSEFERIQATTTFNGLSLLTNNQSQLSLQLGVGFHGKLNINVGIQGTGSSGSSSSSELFSEFEWSASTTEVSYGYAVGDVDGDGDGDYVTETDGNGTLTLRLWNGSSYDAATEFRSGSGEQVQGMALGDLTNDGQDDLVVSYANGDVEVFIASGGDLISNGVVQVSGGINSDLRPVIADMDGDGFRDVVVAAGQNIDMLINNQAGELQFFDSTAAGSIITHLVVGEFNGDSDVDVMVSRQGTSELFLHRGAGGGSLAGALGTGINAFGKFAAMGSNIVALESQAEISVWENIGGNFVKGASFGGSETMTEVSVGDVNGDSILDIVAADATAGFTVLVAEDGGSSYTYTASLSAPFGSGALKDILAYDTNDDGLMDFYGRDDLTNQGIGGLSVAYTTTADGQTIIALEDFNLLNAASARFALTTLDSALEKVTATRGNIGAALARVDSALAAIVALRDNYQQSASRIQDADIAFESANYTRFQILQQTAASVLAQANQVPSLSLLLLNS